MNTTQRNSAITATLLSLVAICSASCESELAPPNSAKTDSANPAPSQASVASRKGTSLNHRVASDSQAPAMRAGASDDEWHCGGELVPPTGWQQETAFESNRNDGARERAGNAAIKKLIERKCADGNGASCSFLEARVQLWKTGSTEKDVCAMAVIKSDDWQEWTNLVATTIELDRKLAEAARQLLKDFRQNSRVAIDLIKDLGVPGGLRADWLSDRMELALQKYAVITSIPKGWAGNGVPPGVDVVVRCDIYSRSERGVPTLDTEWTALGPHDRKVHSDSVSIPESAAPPIPAPKAPKTIPESEGISVRLDSRRGGSLCAGDRTQIWLQADEQLYVRVFNLYGNGEALALFPNGEQPMSLVPARQSVPLGGRLGFEAVPVPGSDQERFLVLGARSESALGRFTDAKGPCRVTPEIAQQLNAVRNIPQGVKVAVTGYRLTSGANCSNPPGRSKREGVVAALNSLPICSF